MNILLVNLTRFGDLLQSQAAINALAGARIAGNVRPAADEPPAFARPGGDPAGEPRNHVALVCLANFVSAGAFLHNIRHYFPLPKDAFLASLLGDSGGAPDPRATGRSPEFGNWTAAVTQLWQLRERIWSEFRPDLVCNLTPTIPARLLAGYLAVPPAGFREPSGRDEKSAAVPVSGFALDAHGFALNSPWASYMQGASRKRGLSPFNVVDVFRPVAGPSFGIPGDTALS